MTQPDLAPGMAEALAESDRLKAAGDEAAEAAFWAEGTPDVPTRDVTYPGADGQPRRARLYMGGVAAPGPILLYIHGGGWTGGSIEANDPACRALAHQSDWNVLSISYRLAPEHPYPAGLADCLAALEWLMHSRPPLGHHPALIAVGGASAGANLALASVVAQPGAFIGALLFYGVYGRDFDTESYRQHADGPGLTRARMQELFAQYDPDETPDPEVTPLIYDRYEVGSACLIAAECDVLRSDSEAMAEVLRRQGIRTDLHVEPGVTHGFINRGRLVPAARDCLTRGAAYLNTIHPKEYP